MGFIWLYVFLILDDNTKYYIIKKIGCVSIRKHFGLNFNIYFHNNLLKKIP